ncbi:MAG: S-layer homology domain-containing protein [Oscillospiraceae bacterium]|nr:S-layer homology domain-containing protein [Oscillospiraceae bacterium]
MKKIISALLAAAVMVPAAVLPVSASSSAWQRDTEITSLLSALDIMVGDDSGNFNLDSYVTRAEMAKIAVASSSYKNTVAKGMSFSPFSDVKSSFWGAPYIQAAVSAGIVDGYIDGTFKPDGTVTYEEAITMMLKVLGYSNSDFGASYPYGQVGAAENLEMTDGMNSGIGEWLTRRQVAQLVANTLDTPMKSTGADLITVHGCQIMEDVTIISDSHDDSKLASDEIATSNGKYRIKGSGFNSDYVGLRGDMVIKDGKYFVAFSPDGDVISNRYIVYATLNDKILAYQAGDNTNLRQLDISSTTTCYKNSNAYTYAALKSEMEMGDIIRVRYNDNNEVDYINYSEGNLVGPLKVTSSSWMGSFETNSSTKVMRDGTKVEKSDIQTNDIVYFCNDLNMIMAYSKKITGIYESASPSKDAPQSVTVSGVSYEIEGSEAFNALSSSGSLNYGDTITLLMGKDGKKIAGVVTNTTSDSITTTLTGYAIAAGRKEFTNSDGTTYTSNYITAVTVNGDSYTYPTTGDVSGRVGSVVNITIKNGKATVGVVSSNNSSIAGLVSYGNRTIGGYKAASNISILDTTSYSAGVPLYTKTYLQRIDGMALTAANIKYYKTNSNGEISELILNNVTGDMYSYGLVTYTHSSTGSGYSTIDIDNSVYTYSTTVQVGTGVQAVLAGGAVKSTTRLAAYSGAVESLTTAEVVIGNNTYTLSDKVKVYKKIDTGNYQSMSLNDAISDFKNYSFVCYYDKPESSGGRIRVIVCTAK